MSGRGLAPCGTPAGYQRCRRRLDKACKACREAQRRYIAQWRESNPEGRARQSQRVAARGRALERLAKRHPAEFESLIREEVA